MKFTLQKELLEKSPNSREALLIVEGLNNKTNSDSSFQFLCEVMDQVREDFVKTRGENVAKTKEWEDAFKNFGMDPKNEKPSHISLLSRILDRKDLPNINPVVNIINAVQIKWLVPIGAHDLDKVDGDIKIGFNIDEKPFLPRDSNTEETVKQSELVHSDDKNILTRKWCWRQGRKDLCTDETSNLVIFINSVNPEDNLNEIADEIAAVIKKFTGSEETKFKLATLSKASNELDTKDFPELSPRTIITIETHHIRKDENIIKRILSKAVEEVLPSKEALEELLKSGRRLKIYHGIDPTADTLHIGHKVMLSKLEEFRKLGHETFLLIGDFTGRIGDPTDKLATRKQLTEEEIAHNIKNFRQQAATIIDLDNKDNPVKVVFNNEWLGKLTFAEIIDLASEFTVQQFLKRDMFQKRLDEDKPIHLHEFIYPLMQGIDALKLKCDIEIGGNDQLFNMLPGRQLIAQRLNKEKLVMTGKLLVTDDGKKMGKSEGNMIKLSDSANDIFGKVMAFSDKQIIPGFELLTNAEELEVSEMEEQMEKGKINPIELKKQLAFRLTLELKGQDQAEKAQEFFENVFQKKNFNVEVPVLEIEDGKINILDLLMKNGRIAKSRSEARRLVEMGGVKVNEIKVQDPKTDVKVKKGDILKAGKKVFRIST